MELLQRRRRQARQGTPSASPPAPSPAKWRCARSSRRALALVEGGRSGLAVMRKTPPAGAWSGSTSLRLAATKATPRARRSAAISRLRRSKRTSISARPVRAKHSPRPTPLLAASFKSARSSGAASASGGPSAGSARPSRRAVSRWQSSRSATSSGGMPALRRSAPSARFSFGIVLRRIAVGGRVQPCRRAQLATVGPGTPPISAAISA